MTSFTMTVILNWIHLTLWPWRSLSFLTLCLTPHTWPFPCLYSLNMTGPSFMVTSNELFLLTCPTHLVMVLITEPCRREKNQMLSWWFLNLLQQDVNWLGFHKPTYFWYLSLGAAFVALQYGIKRLRGLVIPLSGPSYTSGDNKSRVIDLTKPETWPSLNPLWRETALHSATTSSVNPWRWVNLQSLTWGMTKPPPTLRLIVITLTYLIEHYHAMTKQDRSYSQDYDRSWWDWQNTPMSIWYDKYSCMVLAIGVYI